MATDPTTKSDLKQIRAFERELRKFAVDYANGMTYEDLIAKFGFTSPEDCVTLAKTLKFPRRRWTPLAENGEKRVPFKFEDLGIPNDFLHRYLHRPQHGTPSAQDWQIWKLQDSDWKTPLARKFGLKVERLDSAIRRVDRWIESCYADDNE